MARIEVVEIEKSSWPPFRRVENRKDKSTTTGEINLSLRQGWQTASFGLETGRLEMFGPSKEVVIDLQHLKPEVRLLEGEPDPSIPEWIKLTKVGDQLIIVNRKARKVVKVRKIDSSVPIPQQNP